MPQADSCLSKPAASAISERVHCVTGAFGAVQIVAVPQQVLVDLQARAYDTIGFLRQDHATALLSLDDAKRLLTELTAAVAQSEALAPSAAPTWSEETLRRVALATRGCRRPNRQRAA